MRIQVCSDLHLEFGPLSVKNTNKADVLVLAGDIFTAKDLFSKDARYNGRFNAFLDEVSQEFDHVVMVAGNPEFYGATFPETYDDLAQFIHTRYHNIWFMQNNVVKFKDVVFFGATLWTDYNRACPITMQTCWNSLNDHKVIKYKNKVDNIYGKLRPVNVFKEFQKTISILQASLEEFQDTQFVVVTHHAPSTLSVPDQFKDDRYLNGAYASSLENFILDNPRITVWAHGHIHQDVDYLVGSTRIVSNPRGYVGYEARADNYPVKIIEV